MKFKVILINLLLILSPQSSDAQITDCQNSCTCTPNIAFTTLSISCSAVGVLTLPSPFKEINLYKVTTLSVIGSGLSDIPNGICSYGNLKQLDLSLNLFSALTSSSFICLGELVTLNLQSSQISSIDSSTFINQNKLVSLDLSYNALSTLPTFVFSNRQGTLLPSLQKLNLQFNFLRTIDPFWVFMRSILTISLNNNQINKFTNGQGFDVQTNGLLPPSFKWATYIDLRNNLITTFDDSVLELYNICDALSFTWFVQYQYNMTIQNNPIRCVCAGSFNMITWSAALTKIPGLSGLDASQLIFRAQCFSGDSVGSVISFAPISGCQASSSSYHLKCPSSVVTRTTAASTATTTTTSYAPPSPDPNIGANSVLNVPPVATSLYDGYIAAIILAILFVLLLIILILYYLNPIECNAFFFNCLPCFYKRCPCTRNNRHDKCYDLFISYNMSNEKWVHCTLIPFIKSKNHLVENYIIHYNVQNSEIFSPYVKDVMSNSSIILIVLSDSYLMHEWNNMQLRNHLRHLKTKENIRLVMIQMHDVCDEEVEEYFRQQLQIPRIVALENDEFMFWHKVYYYLFTNNHVKSVMPSYAPDPVEIKAKEARLAIKPNDGIEFNTYNIHRPIVHVDGRSDPYERDLPNVKLMSSSGQQRVVAEESDCECLSSERSADECNEKKGKPCCNGCAEGARCEGQHKRGYTNKGYRSINDSYA